LPPVAVLQQQPSTLLPYTPLFRSRTDDSCCCSTRADVKTAHARVAGIAFVDDRPDVPPLSKSDRVRRKELQYKTVIVISRGRGRSEEHTSELQSRGQLVCRLLLEK